MNTKKDSEEDSRRANPVQSTTHHLIPRSRLTDLMKRQLRDLKISNHKNVPRWRHELWHYIFINMTPFEVVLTIIEHFGQSSVVEASVQAQLLGMQYEYQFKGKDSNPGQFTSNYSPSMKQKKALGRLFKGKNWANVIAEIVESWAPKGYFVFVEVEFSGSGEKIKFSYDAEDNQKN